MAAPGDLPQARDPRPRVKALVVPWLVPGHLAGQSGARAHQAHLPAQHVQQIRQLVDTQLADNTPDARAPWIALVLEHQGAFAVARVHLGMALLGILIHRAELETREGAAVTPHAGLRNDDGPR